MSDVQKTRPKGNVAKVVHWPVRERLTDGSIQWRKILWILDLKSSPFMLTETWLNSILTSWKGKKIVFLRCGTISEIRDAEAAVQSISAYISWSNICIRDSSLCWDFEVNVSFTLLSRLGTRFFSSISEKVDHQNKPPKLYDFLRNASMEKTSNNAYVVIIPSTEPVLCLLLITRN